MAEEKREHVEHIDEMAAQLRPAGPMILAPGHTFATITDKISAVVLSRDTPGAWFLATGVAGALAAFLLFATGYQLARGIGIWGVNIPVAWGFAIVNFVWWIGIGHAGTLISAILLLLKQKWRNSINRFAEAMTLFAVMCAGYYPVMHLGRPWLAYWLFPYPNTMGVWPQFRSPLVWDVFAVSTYFTVSLLFWYQGLIPDLATLRDRSQSRAGRVIYGVLAMGWRGSARHWKRYESAYRLLAGLATPLVVSVHTVVSFDFAIALVPGWHTSIFPPYFVAGAIYSGFAMVLVLAIPIRKIYGLEDFITEKHLDNCAKLMLATGQIVAYGYIIESFMAWYSGDIYDRYMIVDRMKGYYAIFYWCLLALNIAFVQVLWLRKVRKSPAMLFVASTVILAAMWLERFVIVVQSLHRDFLPSSWAEYLPTRWDVSQYIGTIGLFAFGMLLFIRFLPMISIFEIRELLPEAHVQPVEAE
jgi:Ni/Fe-hydrogenase subunit HybB-like protein